MPYSLFVSFPTVSQGLGAFLKPHLRDPWDNPTVKQILLLYILVFYNQFFVRIFSTSSLKKYIECLNLNEISNNPDFSELSDSLQLNETSPKLLCIVSTGKPNIL